MPHWCPGGLEIEYGEDGVERALRGVAELLSNLFNVKSQLKDRICSDLSEKHTLTSSPADKRQKADVSGFYEGDGVF